VKTWFEFTPNTTQLRAKPMKAAPSVSSTGKSEGITADVVDEGRNGKA
jgi:hypothetical protein